MEIQIGEILYIGGEGSLYQLSPSIEGLASADIRTGDGVYAGRDGGYVAGQFYGHRTIVIPGFYVGNSCTQASQLRSALMRFLKIRYALPIRITTASGRYYTEGYVTDVKATIDNLKAGEFQITLLCPDPNLYVVADGEQDPLVTERTLVNEDTTVVTNLGDVDIYPTITVTGILDGIEISNDTTEKTMQIDIATESDDDEVVIDMNKRIITLNGEAVNENRSLLSSWWCLVPGNNSIITSIGEDSGSVIETTISYKRGRIGI